MEITLYVTREDYAAELTVCGAVSEYRPARLSGHPDTWCPDEGGDVEIWDVLLDGKEWDGELTKAERDRAEQALIDAWHTAY